MHRPTIFATVSAFAILLGASPTLAQSVPDLRIGSEIKGVLDGADSASNEDYRFEDHLVTARAGQRLEATMRSTDFDTFLAIYREAGIDGEPLASDDDGLGEGTDSRLRFTPQEDGRYVLRARTLSGLDGGAFTLSLVERPPAPRAPRPTGMRIGQTRTGSLSVTDAESDEGTRFDGYSVSLRAGQRVVMTLKSDDFDPVVSIGRSNRAGYAELARNDDGGGDGLNSYLVFTAPETGTYDVRASSLGVDGLGDYSLDLAQGPAPLTAQAIALGDSLSGELQSTDGLNDAGLRADAYRFSGRAGQRIQATMRSEAFDAYLELFSLVDGVQATLGTDDDGADGEGTDARLTQVLPADGDYVIEARALVDGATGAYSLTLGETAPEAPPTPLAFDTVVQGEIKDTDANDDEGRGYHAYGFSGIEGNRVQIVMRSGDFDTFLQVSRAEGTFSMLASDDDGLGEGTDSRLTYILPATGDYVVRASALGSEDDEGLYSIELTDRGPQPVNGSILSGTTARGTLTETDAIAEDGTHYDAYEIAVADGEKLRLTMVSNDFDAVIEVGKAGEDWEAVATDDDGLSDTHARLEWTVEGGGDYVIRARAFGQGEFGAYALTVEPRT
ncbi:PPC domain-containing protein [Brevundimonas variabilis]|uniref:Peptidase C-terminal archaeal/bacterial domain-containing protein n=1 Tax=Brevundimonas variabilis TaxID=74312 RepID=A0A7W9FEE8_9CAUL|nr:PPC domain-containing protein [Brevundimonas variabilis]MBB5746230.1 hypothetical protein [Brevundimonas variabilis]